MARYGVSLYGTDFYGAPPISSFSAEPFTAMETNFGTITLSWVNPTGLWTELRLLRNLLGYPLDELNGTVVEDVVQGSGGGSGGLPATVVDTDLPQGVWVYYSIFSYDPSEEIWYLSGTASAFSVADEGTTTRMYDLIPDVYKQADLNIATAPMVGGDLSNFIALFGFVLEAIRNRINSGLDLYNWMQVKYDLVTLLMAQFGAPVETAIIPENYRRFLANAVYLFQTKGTIPCIEVLASCISGWKTTITIGNNLLWDDSLSTFDFGISPLWGATSVNCTVAQGTETLTSGLLVNTLKLTATAGGSVSCSFGTPATQPDVGTPCQAGDTYVISGSMASSTASGANGNFVGRFQVVNPILSSASLTSFTGSGPYTLTIGTTAAQVNVGAACTGSGLVGTWLVTATTGTTVTVAGGTGTPSDTHTYTFSGGVDPSSVDVDGSSSVLIRKAIDTEVSAVIVAPTNATFFYPVISITAADEGDVFSIANLQININEQLDREPGRDLRIVLAADRINQIVNGSFETGLSGWSTIGSATQEIVDNSLVGSFADQVTYTGSGVTDGLSDGVTYTVPTVIGRTYVVQWQAKGDTGVLPTDVVLAAWVVPQGSAPTSPGVLADVGGQPYAQMPTLQFVAETGQTVFGVTFYDAAHEAAFTIDAVLCEFLPGGNAQSEVEAYDPDGYYFDGSTPSTTLDFLWEGTPYLSRSHCYHRRAISDARLRADIPLYLPFGRTFTLLYAQPAQSIVADPTPIGYVSAGSTEAPDTAGVSNTVEVVWNVRKGVVSELTVIWNVA